MSDLIKKIKIKKQDGTYTDYIPIGAEAKNVDCSDGESVEYKLNKKPYYYNNVADMKADTKLKVGDMAITLGYYEAEDGGNAEYYITKGSYEDDGGSYHQLNNNLYAKLIIKDYTVGVKQFGAKGDGLTDDSTTIQKCINYAHNKGLEVLINPSSTFYYIKTPLEVHANHGTAGGYNGKNGTVIKGAQAGRCVLYKIGNDTLPNDNINAILVCRDTSSSGIGVIIKNLVLYNRSSSVANQFFTDQNALGIYNKIANSTFDNLMISAFNGLYSESFNCIYNNLNISFGGNGTNAPTLNGLTSYGLKLRNSTSSNLSSILSYGRGIAYDISSYYSSINNCFGSGNINFKVSGSGLSFNGCGSENAKAQYQFYTENDQTNFAINGYYCYRQIGDNDNNIAINDTAFCCCKNAMRVSIKNVQILNNDITGIDSNNTGYIFNILEQPYTPTYTSIDCIDYYPRGNSDINMRLWKNAPKNSEPQKLTTPTEDFMYYYWNGKIYPFIGGQFNHKNTQSIVNFLNSQDEGETHSIWLDSITNNQSSQGFIDNGSQHLNLGDLMLNNNPKSYNLAMRVITEYTDDSHYGTSIVPIILKGTSAERPTQHLYTGLCYFDTTLNKPIWYNVNSSRWVDSTGTNV